MVKPPKEDELMLFLKCPNCNCQQFTEHTSQTATQRGIRLGSDGFANLDHAGDIEFDEHITLLFYECEACNAQYLFAGGTLQHKSII